ncbi:DNA methylase, partial [Thiolapillus sp.]|uniref:DNA methylase n=1 Tax=Thiolapillus sp. TaxID=2017437 RepID=UPI003AF72D57
GVRTEKLWFNFTPDRVHWASCAGRNFTDRQRIKRRAANWGEELPGTAAAERLTVLAAMMAVEAEDAAGSG